MTSVAGGDRSRSIRRDLILRMAGASLFLTLIVGGGTILLERRRIAAAIEERATLGAGLVRARVHRIARATGEPWQGVVPRALAQLAEEMPAADLGRFGFLEVLDAEGRPLPGIAIEDASLARLLSLAKEHGFPANPDRLQLARLRGSPVSGAVAVAMPVADLEGNRVGRIDGVFVVSAKTVAAAERRLVITVLTVVAIVIATTLLIYPLIRRLVRRLADLSIHLLDANLETLMVLGSAIAKRDSDTDAHNYRVTIYAVRLAEAIAADGAAIRRLIKGAFLHDVGKIGVRDRILLKPGRLDAEEFEIMKTHVRHGLEIIERSAWLRDAGEVIAGHHEQYTGAGYYAGVRGEEIPLTARIFAVADVFDALTSERPYKTPMTVEESIAILEKGAGQHFDPALVAAFTPIAAGLYARFGGDHEASRRELETIMRRYFRTDLGVILEEAPAGR